MLVKAHPIFRTNAAQLWGDFVEAQSEFDRLFQWNFTNGVTGYYPPVNIRENEDAYTVEARVPGLTKDDIAVELEGKKLTIRGEHKREEVEFTREERATGKFERIVTFKNILAPEGVEAEVKNGILTVKLPKAAESKPRKISVLAK